MNELKITCLVDNCVSLSSHFWGEHGLSFYIETFSGNFCFDCGQTPNVLSHNIALLKMDVKSVEHIVLSHGHYDHTGGLLWLLKETNRPVIHTDPNIFINKYALRKQHRKDIGFPFSKNDIQNQATLSLSTEIEELYPDVFISGRIPRTNPFETGDAELFTCDENNPENILQDEILDDRCMIFKTTRGLIILLGCCHSGIINTLSYVTNLFPLHIHAVIGGAHMASISSERMRFTLANLKHRFHPDLLLFNHCTGSDTLANLRCHLGTHVGTFPVGSTFTI